MKGKTMARVLMPDVDFIGDDYASIVGLYDYAVNVQRLKSGDFELDFDDSFATFNASQLAQLAELLRRMSSGEPLKD